MQLHEDPDQRDNPAKVESDVTVAEEPAARVGYVVLTVTLCAVLLVGAFALALIGTA